MEQNITIKVRDIYSDASSFEFSGNVLNLVESRSPSGSKSLSFSFRAIDKSKNMDEFKQKIQKMVKSCYPPTAYLVATWDSGYTTDGSFGVVEIRADDIFVFSGRLTSFSIGPISKKKFSFWKFWERGCGCADIDFSLKELT